MRWSLEPLGAAIRRDGGLLQTGPFGSQLKQAEYRPEGVPVIMPKDILDGGVLTGSVARVPEATADRLSRHKIMAQGIVLPRRGEVTKRAFIRAEQEGWLCGTGCIKIEVNGKVLWPKYVYYFLGTKNSIDWLEKNAVGSTMLNLSAGIVSRFPIRYPDISTQKSIAGILSTYDAFIDNNTRRIELLETSARLLFEEWFVRLRYPGHEHDKIIDGVPKGWRRELIGGLTSFISRGITPHYDDAAPGIVINQKCVRNGRLSLELARHQSKEVPKDKVVRIWDVLINSTGEGTLGRIAQIEEGVANCTVDFDLTIVRPHEGIDTHFFGLSVGRLENYFVGQGRGATNQKELSRATIEDVQLLVAPASLQLAFNDFVAPVKSQVLALSKQIAAASQARDLLLPRLMDGRIEI